MPDVPDRVDDVRPVTVGTLTGLRCPCGATGYATRTDLSRHLWTEHRLSRPRAIDATHVIEAGGTLDEATLALIVPQPAAPEDAESPSETLVADTGGPAPLPQPKRCAYCHRSDGTHRETCHTLHRAERCRMCAKLGEPCRWHGGVSHSTAASGRRERKAAGVPETGTLTFSGTLTFLDAEIAAMEAEVARLGERLGQWRAAREALGAIG